MPVFHTQQSAFSLFLFKHTDKEYQALRLDFLSCYFNSFIINAKTQL